MTAAKQTGCTIHRHGLTRQQNCIAKSALQTRSTLPIQIATVERYRPAYDIRNIVDLLAQRMIIQRLDQVMCKRILPQHRGIPIRLWHGRLRACPTAAIAGRRSRRL